MKFNALMHVNIRVKDWDKMVDFYQNKLGLTVNDIQKTYQEFKAKDIPVLGEPSKGPAGTWKFWSHDPENNYFEVMQYTKDSYQVNGHVDE